MIETTILIPEWRRPHFLEVCLEALFKNSRYKHKILVVGGDFDKESHDFRYSKDKTLYKKYDNMNDFIMKRKKWLDENDVVFVDTSELLERQRLKEETEKSGKEWKGGRDTAFNDNIGIGHINTKWLFWNWDDDFIAAPYWDMNLLRHVDDSRNDTVYLPSHVQPLFGNTEEILKVDPQNVWNTSSHISIHRLTLPISYRNAEPSGGGYIFESELNEFVKRNSIPDTVEELCSVRNRVHWLPMLIQKSLYLKVGGCDYRGSGYDIGFDDKLGSFGIRKVMARDSFIIHRANMIWDVTG